MKIVFKNLEKKGNCHENECVYEKSYNDVGFNVV